MAQELIADDRPIKMLCYGMPHDEGLCEVGKNNVVAIEPYLENGEMAPVVWFNIYLSEEFEPRTRVNGKFVSAVAYSSPPTKD